MSQPSLSHPSKISHMDAKQVGLRAIQAPGLETATFQYCRVATCILSQESSGVNRGQREHEGIEDVQMKWVVRCSLNCQLLSLAVLVLCVISPLA